MSLVAFEITKDDVANALCCNENLAEKVFDKLDFGCIEKEALEEEDIDAQLSNAYAEIIRQYDEMSFLK